MFPDPAGHPWAGSHMECPQSKPPYQGTFTKETPGSFFGGIQSPQGCFLGKWDLWFPSGVLCEKQVSTPPPQTAHVHLLSLGPRPPAVLRATGFRCLPTPASGFYSLCPALGPCGCKSPVLDFPLVCEAVWLTLVSLWEVDAASCPWDPGFQGHREQVRPWECRSLKRHPLR